jgi:hypothetical protein
MNPTPSATKRAIKAAVRLRDGMRCTQCGITNAQHLAAHGRSLHVHRLTPGSHYTVEGCVTLCFACHGPHPRLPHGAPDIEHPGIRATLTPDLYDALALYLASLELRPSLSSVVRLAIEQLLRSKGYWPPGQRPA